MKFKVGDKVIPRKFDSNNRYGVHFDSNMNNFLGKEYEIDCVYERSYGLSCDWAWIEDALELVSEPQEYFYVGQIVYSPFFQNKEKKAIIEGVFIGEEYPIRISADGYNYTFTLDGKLKEEHDFISLFQEPIQFPVNKPIEIFEKGEVVEVSDCGSLWMISYYRCRSGNENYPYKCSSLKRDGEVTDGVNYKKIRKIK